MVVSRIGMRVAELAAVASAAAAAGLCRARCDRVEGLAAAAAGSFGDEIVLVTADCNNANAADSLSRRIVSLVYS